MQGASTVAVAFVLAAAVPAASSAQQAPGLGVPPVAAVPQAPQAPLPSVTVPSVPALPTPTPSLPSPSLPAPSVPVASVPVPSVPDVRVPDVRVPSVTAPRVPAAAPPPPSGDLPRSVTGGSGPVAPGGALGASSRGAGPDTGGQVPSGTVARVGASGSPPGRARRAARAAALLGGKGVLGTSFRTRRRLVRALSGCVDRLPRRQDRLLSLRYGLGDAQPRPAREVAGMLNLSRRQYVVVERRALRGLVRAARGGACEVGGGGDASARLPGYPASGPGGIGRSLATPTPASGSQQEAIGVLGRRASGGELRERDRRSGFITPLALDGEEPGGSVIATLVFMAALTGVGVIALRPLLAAARRRRGHPTNA
jgi:hypothetical protein